MERSFIDLGDGALFVAEDGLSGETRLFVRDGPNARPLMFAGFGPSGSPVFEFVTGTHRFETGKRVRELIPRR